MKTERGGKEGRGKEKKGKEKWKGKEERGKGKENVKYYNYIIVPLQILRNTYKTLI